MNYNLLKDILALVECYEKETEGGPSEVTTLEGFKRLVCRDNVKSNGFFGVQWEGKEDGRSLESVLTTLLVHLNRYAKQYVKSAISDSGFSTQDDYVFLLNLKIFGPMTKTELIKKNSYEKSGGMQIIGRLIEQDWVSQTYSKKDKRSKIIAITGKGRRTLAAQMDNVRKATTVIAGDLTAHEKLTLVRLLQKLEAFHQPIYAGNFETPDLLARAEEIYLNRTKHA